VQACCLHESLGNARQQQIRRGVHVGKRIIDIFMGEAAEPTTRASRNLAGTSSGPKFFHPGALTAILCLTSDAGALQN
jgi:hypothetical protein